MATSCEGARPSCRTARPYGQCRCARTTRSARHESCAVAGHLGLLPRTDDGARRAQRSAAWRVPEADIDANLDYARQHFVDHVRAGGPLPALRAGKQPYGVLPVTALDLWGAVPEDGELASRNDAADETWCGAYRTTGPSRAARRRAWASTRIRTSISRKCSAWTDCPRATRSANIFGLVLHPGTVRVPAHVRRQTNGIACNGRRRCRHWSFLAGLSGITAARRADAYAIRSRSGLSLPLIQASSNADFTFNYLDQLLKAPNLDALLQHASVPAPFSLLYLLLRHSMMVEYANAAARVLGRAPHLRAEPEHVRFSALPMETPLDRITAAGLHTGTGVHATRRRQRAGVPQESRCAEGDEDRPAVDVDARHPRSVVAPSRCLGHVVRNQALEDHAPERSGRRVSREAMAGSKTCCLAPPRTRGHAARRRTGTAIRASRNDPGLRARAVAGSCRHRRRCCAAGTSPIGRTPIQARSAGDRPLVRTRSHRAIPARWRAIRPAARRLARIPLRARLARAGSTSSSPPFASWRRFSSRASTRPDKPSEVVAGEPCRRRAQPHRRRRCRRIVFLCFSS